MPYVFIRFPFSNIFWNKTGVAFFLFIASKTAKIAKDYGIEQAAVKGYRQVKDGLNVANRWPVVYIILFLNQMLLLIVFLQFALLYTTPVLVKRFGVRQSYRAFYFC